MESNDLYVLNRILVSGIKGPANHHEEMQVISKLSGPKWTPDFHPEQITLKDFQFSPLVFHSVMPVPGLLMSMSEIAEDVVLGLLALGREADPLLDLLTADGTSYGRSAMLSHYGLTNSPHLQAQLSRKHPGACKKARLALKAQAEIGECFGWEWAEANWGCARHSGNMVMSRNREGILQITFRSDTSAPIGIFCTLSAHFPDLMFSAFAFDCREEENYSFRGITEDPGLMEYQESWEISDLASVMGAIYDEHIPALIDAADSPGDHAGDQSAVAHQI